MQYLGEVLHPSCLLTQAFCSVLVNQVHFHTYWHRLESTLQLLNAIWRHGKCFDPSASEYKLIRALNSSSHIPIWAQTPGLSTSVLASAHLLKEAGLLIQPGLHFRDYLLQPASLFFHVSLLMGQMILQHFASGGRGERWSLEFCSYIQANSCLRIKALTRLSPIILGISVTEKLHAADSCTPGSSL